MMAAALARSARRQQRHLDMIVRNDRIRALARAGRDLGDICAEADRGPNYVRRIAAWRLKTPKTGAL